MTGIKLVDQTVEDVRARLAKMSDEELIQYGEDAAYMADPKIQRKVDPDYVMQLRECRTEYRRRHPKKEK